jgi:hypothetical protein
MTLAVAAMSVVFPWEPGHRLMSHSACGGAGAGEIYVLGGQPRAGSPLQAKARKSFVRLECETHRDLWKKDEKCRYLRSAFPEPEETNDELTRSSPRLRW